MENIRKIVSIMNENLGATICIHYTYPYAGFLVKFAVSTAWDNAWTRI